jgi:monoterpene epsilon-lactone hydrolase
VVRVPLPVVRVVLDRVARPSLSRRVPISVQRAVSNVLMAGVRPPRSVRVQDVVLGGRPARRFGTGRDAVLWVHGGAFITGSYATHGPFAARLADASGCVVYLLDYRLAPEHPHPAAVDDVRAALADVPEQRVVLGGDSAGGALALLAEPRDVVGVALVSPIIDLTHTSARAWAGQDVLLNLSWAEMGVEKMFGTAPPTVPDPLVPTVVHVAEHERLRPEGEALAGRVGAVLHVVPRGWHDIHLQAGIVREGDVALTQLAVQIRELFA